MDKTPTEMTIKELEKAAPKMSDEELLAAFKAEKAAGPDKERSGAVELYEKLAAEREITLTDAEPKTDGELAADTAGAQPAGPTATEDEREDHAETLRKLNKRVAELEGAAAGEGKGEVTRAEILKLHRQLEALANHLNFRLPA